MTLTLDLPHDLGRELSAEADRLGLPVEQYAVRLLSKKPSAPTPRNGAELVEYWQREGVVGSRPDIEDSLDHAREIRRQAETRLRD